MQLEDIVREVAEDLRRAAAVGGEETARVAELLVGSVEATLRLRFLEALHAAAQELEASSAGVTVDVRLEGGEPALSLSFPRPEAREGGDDEAAGLVDGELLRLTIRLPEGLKARVEQAAAGAGASINSWIVAALARALDVQSPGVPHASRRLPRRMTGFVQG